VPYFAGTVGDVVPGMDLFWAVSDLGERRIIEFGRFEVYVPER
jgi:hypothetical protein